MAGETQTTIQELINAKTAKYEAEGLGQIQNVWHEHPDNQLGVISSQEALVFDIEPERWPRMWAALLAFEEYTEFCRADRYPKECWDEIRKDRPDIPRDMENVEAFAEFGVTYAGLTAEDAYRAWYKWEVWHFRLGHHYYPTCTNKISEYYQTQKLRDELGKALAVISDQALSSILPRLLEQNRKLKATVGMLLVGGTIAWLAVLASYI